MCSFGFRDKSVAGTLRRTSVCREINQPTTRAAGFRFNAVQHCYHRIEQHKFLKIATAAARDVN